MRDGSAGNRGKPSGPRDERRADYLDFVLGDLSEPRPRSRRYLQHLDELVRQRHRWPDLPQLLNTLGNGNTFLMYGGLNALFIIFFLLYVPETKGVSLEKIEFNLLSGLPLRKIGPDSDEALKE